MNINNKGRRHELKMLKYKKRLKLYKATSLYAESCNLYAFRSHGKPCSCALCSPGKVLSNGNKKKLFKIIQFELQEHEGRYDEIEFDPKYNRYFEPEFEDILMYA